MAILATRGHRVKSLRRDKGDFFFPFRGWWEFEMHCLRGRWRQRLTTFKEYLDKYLNRQALEGSRPSSDKWDQCRWLPDCQHREGGFKSLVLSFMSLCHYLNFPSKLQLCTYQGTWAVTLLVWTPPRMAHSISFHQGNK